MKLLLGEDGNPAQQSQLRHKGLMDSLLINSDKEESMPYCRKETDLNKGSNLVERNRVINSLEAKLQRSRSPVVSLEANIYTPEVGESEKKGKDIDKK